MDVDTLIRSMPPGYMTYSRVQVPGGEWMTALLVREDRAHVNALGSNPQIALRAGMFTEGDVLLVAIMIKVNQEPPYDTWLNYHQSGGGQDYIDDLASQERLPILFYTEAGRKRSISIRNGLADFIATVAPALSAAPPWTMQAFDAARDRLYTRYPDQAALWRTLALPWEGGMHDK